MLGLSLNWTLETVKLSVQTSISKQDPEILNLLRGGACISHDTGEKRNTAFLLLLELLP